MAPLKKGESSTSTTGDLVFTRYGTYYLGNYLLSLSPNLSMRGSRSLSRKSLISDGGKGSLSKEPL